MIINFYYLKIDKKIFKDQFLSLNAMNKSVTSTIRMPATTTCVTSLHAWEESSGIHITTRLHTGDSQLDDMRGSLILLVTFLDLSSGYIETDLVFMDNPPEFSQEEKSSHVSSSIEDLATLVRQELKAFDLVESSLKEVEAVKEAVKLKKNLSKLLSNRPSLAFNITREEALLYISHPLNSYHLLRRSANLWTKYTQIIKKFFASLPKKISKVWCQTF